MQQRTIFLLVLAVCVLLFSRVSTEPYYVTPSTSVPCPVEGIDCYTLAQYASKPNDYFISNTSLIFLPGNHNLDSELVIGNITYLNITTYITSSTITCSTPIALFFLNIRQVHASGLQILGCKLMVSKVDQFTFSDCQYQGQGQYGNGMHLKHVGDAKFERSTFSSNYGVQLQDTKKRNLIIYVGGAIYSSHSSVYIRDSYFAENTAQNGGAVCTWKSTIKVHNSTFIDNNVLYSRYKEGDKHFPKTVSLGYDDSAILHFFKYHIAMGGAIYVAGSADNGTCNISNSFFIQNKAVDSGGAICIKTTNGNFYISKTVYTHNTAKNAGALGIYNNNLVYINSTRFTSNKAKQYGGALTANGNNLVSIRNTQFIGNTAVLAAGAAGIYEGTRVLLYDSIFVNNSVWVIGGGLNIEGSNYHHDHVISNTTFSHNSAASIGGAFASGNLQLNLSDVKFINNSAAVGGAIFALSANISSTGLINIQENIGYHYCVVYLVNCTISHVGRFSFRKNSGSLFASQSSNVTFAGHTQFSHNVPINSPDAPLQEGGALTCSLSTIVFTGTTYIANNEAENGGAILSTDSIFYMYGNVTFANNIARKSGGSIYAYQSELIFWGDTTISHNKAIQKGGGMLLFSTKARFTTGSLQYYKNGASQGGGVFLQSNAKLYVVKSQLECENNNEGNCSNPNPATWIRLEFIGNFADYGGALYVSDDINSGTCASIPKRHEQITSGECFLQTPSLFPIVQSHSAPNSLLHIRNVYFMNNSATQSGAVMYGGLIDRCKPGPFAEIRVKHPQYYIDGVSYLLNVTNLQTDDFKTQSEISSDPVRICFCRDNQPDCNYHPQPLKVRKGQTFKLSLVAVDQVNNTIPNTNIYGSVSSQGGLKQGQSVQRTANKCKEITYNAFSSNSSENLVIYAEGPCKDLGISKKSLNIHFVPCPNGFVESTTAGCQCDPTLYPEYISNCSVDNETVLKKEKVWISLRKFNATSQVEFVTYKYCPFEYCHPKPVDVDMKIPNGSDSQCAFNRSGNLCGSCKNGLSVSLGSSHCLSCTNNWLALLLVFAIAGIAVVALLLVCNFTVAVGTINGLILYANVVAANQTIFFPFETPNVLTVFIAWLNLDFGFQTCFYDGMDGYDKTWLQFAFPAYTIFLVIIIILISTYSQRFARIISNKNPVATLATLILLSYAKLLRTIIAALSFATLDYSDGSKEVVWLVDGNVPYLKGKHIPLFITALFIILVGLVYTLFLFSWMWLLRCPNWRSLKWLRNTKLHSFMDAYNAPYSAKHRYWTGLLLLVRAILYLISALNIFGDPSFNLLFITCTITGLLLLDKSVDRVYKNKFLNGLESSFLYNLIIFTVATLYLQKSAGSQSALAYTSTAIAFVTFLAILIYHTYAFVLCANKHNNKNLFQENQVTNPLIRNNERSRYEQLHSAFDLSQDDLHADEFEANRELSESLQQPRSVTCSEVSIHDIT